MTKWLEVSLLAAGLCCAPAARAQSTLNSAPATLLPAPVVGSTLAADSSSAIKSVPAIGSSSVINSAEDEAGPVRGGHEMELWVTQSHALQFISNVSDNLFQVGGRYGWVLTDPIGPGPLRGQFEYAVNFIPLIIPFQPNGPTYGFGADPFTLKWNFQRRGNIIPYADASAGGMAILKRVPPLGSYWDFTASGGFGVQIVRGRYVWSVDCRFYHISDAGIIADDPSLNTIQIRVGFGLFVHPRSHSK